MNDSNTAEICRQMDRVRHSLGDDVEDIVDSARTLTDWRYYLQKYPWACLAGGMAIGYLVVPSHVEIVRPTADVMEELARRNKLVVETNPQPHAKSSLSGTVLGLLANAAVRAAVGYLSQNAGNLWHNAHTGDTNGEPHR